MKDHPGHLGGFQDVQDCFLHLGTQLILAGGDLSCKDATDDVLMFSALT